MSKADIDLTIDEDFERDLDRWISDVLRAGTQAVATTTRSLEKSIETVTMFSTRGRLWRAWKSDTWPRDGRPAYVPTGRVFVNGKSGPRSMGAMQYFTQPGINRAKSGKFLAVPLPSAFGGRRAPHDMTPRKWEFQHGMKLRFVDRGRTKAALLVADQAINRFGHHVKYDATKERGGQVMRQVTVPVFALIPFQRFANRVSIDPIVRRHEGLLAAEFERRVEQLERIK